ncbi:hypothetical protein JEZ13_08675 [bacterium]|nr:hypothetical protein [bacterium]
MSKIITESGMKFGPFEDKYLYEIEKSKMVQTLQIKIVEIIIYYKKSLIFLEAKSSSPDPNQAFSDRQCNFDEYIKDVSRKFINSVNIFVSICIKRNKDKISTELEKIDFSTTNIKLLLVIKDHKMEWLSPINDALKFRLNDLCKSLNINPSNILTINDTMAKEKKLLV